MLVNGSQIIGNNEKFNKAVDYARNLAVTKNPILVVGERGTGKRTLSHYIHQNSARSDKPLLVVDCTKDSIDVQNEILGYRDEEGKFHRGVLERANEGMVVFANIEGLNEQFQKKLFSILSELNDYDLDIRTIATTTKNLSKYVGSGRFSRALFSYFSSTMINLPSLRDRKDDIEEIVGYFLDQYSNEISCDVPILTEKAKDKIQNYYWANNLIELQSTLRNAIDNQTSGEIDLEHLENSEKKSNNGIVDEDETFRLMSLKEAEKLLIKKALIHTSENRTQAAKILGVSIRTLRNKINEYRADGTQYFVNLR